MKFLRFNYILLPILKISIGERFLLAKRSYSCTKIIIVI